MLKIGTDSYRHITKMEQELSSTKNHKYGNKSSNQLGRELENKLLY